MNDTAISGTDLLSIARKPMLAMIDM